MRDILQLTWPDTFGRRFKLALVINLLFVCGVTFLAGLIFGPVFIPTTIILIVVSALMAALTAVLANPGAPTSGSRCPGGPEATHQLACSGRPSS